MYNVRGVRLGHVLDACCASSCFAASYLSIVQSHVPTAAVLSDTSNTRQIDMGTGLGFCVFAAALVVAAGIVGSLYVHTSLQAFVAHKL